MKVKKMAATCALAAIAALVLFSCLMTAAKAAEPQGFASLQPFQKFGKGEGHGVAIEYVPRDKAQFVAWLRENKKMRVSCESLVRQMAEVHNLPFEGCEGAVAEISRNDDYKVVACRDEMFQRDNLLAVTDSTGTFWSVWHRRCLAGEQVLVYKGQPIISTMCGNTAVPVKRQVVAMTTQVVTGACPNGIALFANAWVYESLPKELQEKADSLVVAATHRDSENASNAKAYQGDSFSRTLGDEIVRRVNVRAPVGVRISAYLRDPATTKVLEELGTFELIDGIARIPLTSEQRERVVETVWPSWFSSPVISGGMRRLWLFPNEWRKPVGGHWCSKQVNGMYKEKNKP